MRILVVDDDPSIRKLHVRWATLLGFEVLEVGDGQTAWERLQQEEIHLVVTDWMMPNLSGIELCRKIRGAAFDHYIYVILCTAKTEKSELIEGMNAGADDFLSKPIAGDEFRVRLRAARRILDLQGGLEERNRQLAQANQELKAAYRLIEEDLKAAAWMQENLLPPKKLSADGVTCHWYFRPSTYVAGDIFNLFSLGNGKVGFYILDVSGHGVPAAMMSVTLSMFLTPEGTHASPLKSLNPETGQFEAQAPEVAVRDLNQRFQSKDDRYFTMIYGVLCTRTQVLRMVQAGHPGPILMKPCGSLTVLGSGGMPVGIWPEIDFDIIEVPFRPGDRLVMYSDGVSECANADGEQFGEDRLNACLRKDAVAPLDELLLGVETALETWRGDADYSDDVSVMALEFNPGAETGKETQ